MARARGSNALLATSFETTPGTTPVGGFYKAPFVSHTMGEERPLITSDLLGLGRETQDPTPDVATDDGDIVVPVDVRNFGRWLKLFFGLPATTGAGPYTHVFTSGASTLPSISLEIGSPEVPAFSMHYGARGNQLKIGMSRSGLLSSTASLIAIGEAAVTTTTAAGTPTALAVLRFAQATGSIKKDGTALGNVVSAEFTYSNNLDKVEVIKADGRIADSDPAMVMMSGSITVRYDTTALQLVAENGTPCDLTFGWTQGAHSLSFDVPRVFLPRGKRPINGPNGIQCTYNWQASGALGASVVVTLINDVTSYTA